MCCTDKVTVHLVFPSGSYVQGCRTLTELWEPQTNVRCQKAAWKKSRTDALWVHSDVHSTVCVCVCARLYARGKTEVNPSNAELNPICQLLALLGAHHILHVSRVRVNVWKILGTITIIFSRTRSVDLCVCACVRACVCEVWCHSELYVITRVWLLAYLSYLTFYIPNQIVSVLVLLPNLLWTLYGSGIANVSEIFWHNFIQLIQRPTFTRP